MVAWVSLQDICKTTVSNCSSKENCETTISCDYDSNKICKTTIIKCGFMIIMINNILKII